MEKQMHQVNEIKKEIVKEFELEELDHWGVVTPLGPTIYETYNGAGTTYCFSIKYMLEVKRIQYVLTKGETDVKYAGVNLDKFKERIYESIRNKIVN